MNGVPVAGSTPASSTSTMCSLPICAVIVASTWKRARRSRSATSDGSITLSAQRRRVVLCETS